MLTSIAMRFEKIVGLLSRILFYVGIVGIMFMILLIVVDVFLRYAFRQPIMGTFEFVQIAMAFLVFLGLAYTECKKGHVGVDILVSHFPKKMQSIIDLCTTILSFGLFVLIASQNTVQGILELKRGETLTLLEIPTFPFKFLVVVGCLMLCLALLVNIFNFIIGRENK
jgi:TRAP-type C4-dicarboxylate transport system permease small subunit